MKIGELDQVGSSDVRSVGGAERSGGEFGAMLNGMLKAAGSDQSGADQAFVNFATGKSTNLQDIVTNLAKAEMSFGFMLEVRNRIVDAYHDLMRMQV